ncbi:unnamed protein product [Arabidopsis arenosa]|uniref:Small ribosomal subunit protein uS15 N-terminal domain-containing protein n=1 Tax=Arabidopsis arenosa TaxID=38785 RepID=A0A8S2ASL4_ARAAE|nr:unnamed protein product [Arabidopsis arenosa]
MESVLVVAVASVILGSLIAVLFFGSYFRKRTSEVQSMAKAEPQDPIRNPKSNHPAPKKNHPKSQASDKNQNKRHHPLDLNTLKGHGDAVTGLCFSSDGRSLATACADGVIRVFKLDDASSKSFKFLRINLPAGGHPTAVAFADDASSIVVACYHLSGSSLYMYGEEKQKDQQGKLPLPSIKWDHHHIHEKRAVLTISGATATYGTADGSAVIASCSEGTDIILWHGKTGRNLGHVDTNQLKNHMAAVSPNGRFLAAAAFTADVKVWEIVYQKDGSVKEVSRVMQLKGHKSAVTWLCFSPNSEKIITASKDGSIRVWNINVRYHLDEDPKTLKVFPIPLCDSGGNPLHYDRLSLCPEGKILAASHGSTLQWLCAETGNVLDTVEKAHEGDITCISWAPKAITVGERHAMVLATSGDDKKVKLWEAPKKGISASALPYKRSSPSWLKTTSQDVDESICKFAKKGLTPSQIGVILRDSHGIPQVKSVTGSKILRILKAHGLAPEIPEDLYHLIKKAVAIRKHLERNRKDKDSKFRLILVESRIHRLARYYKKTKKLPPVWKYESTTASTLVA